MTQEEKAKAYDKALGRAKEINNEHKAQPFDVMLKVFPELAESEDERIRKAVIYVVNHADYSIIEKTDFLATQMTNWLEKQVQKPYGQRNECLDCQFNYAGECKGSCAMKRGEQKSTEWSEEDEEHIESILCALKCFEAENYDRQDVAELYRSDMNWIISLRPQPKQEWSEGDEEMLNLIIARLHSHPNIDLEEYSKEYDWLNYRLKPLRPQNRWKPTEEMLEALGRVIPENVMEISEDEMLLSELYQGLKYGRVLSKD